MGDVLAENPVPLMVVVSDVPHVTGHDRRIRSCILSVMRSPHAIVRRLTQRRNRKRKAIVLYMTPTSQLCKTNPTSINAFDRNGVQIYALETSDVYRPAVEGLHSFE
jgi:hypothetical protein